MRPHQVSLDDPSRLQRHPLESPHALAESCHKLLPAMRQCWCSAVTTYAGVEIKALRDQYLK